MTSFQKMSRLTDETVSWGSEDCIEDPVTAIQGLLLSISEHVKDLSKENDRLKIELSQPNQNQACSPDLEEKEHANTGKQKMVTQNAEHHISLSEDCQKIIKDLKFQRNHLPKQEFMEKLAINHLDHLLTKFKRAREEFDSYLAAARCQDWYENSEAEGEWFKLLTAENDLKGIKNYAMNKKDEDAGPSQVTLKNKTENPETLKTIKTFLKTKDVQCNLCRHLSSLGVIHISKVHAKSGTKPGSEPLTETCPWIVKLPVEGKRNLLHAYKDFCKICLKFHIRGEKPCDFTVLHPGLKCRVNGCQERWILCVEHHDKNESKLRRFKITCAQAGIGTNIELTY